MSRRLLLFVVAALSVAATIASMPGFSSASFTARTSNTGSVRAAADWTPPAVSLQNPGSPLSGAVSVTATATDAESGVAIVRVEYAPANGSSWVTLCTATAPPYTCNWDTTSLADGTYDLRAVATDGAGYSTTSTTIAGRLVDNTVSSVSMNDPDARLAGTVTLSAEASATAGVTSVSIQRAPRGSTTWTDVCTDPASPYTCTWDTATVADGLYDLRAVMVVASAEVTASDTLIARRVDNSPLRGLDVQTANGGATGGKLETGDTVTFTYSEQVNPATVTTGWNGAATAVTLRVRDGNLLGLGNNGDTLDVQRTGGTVNLGSANLKEDYVKSDKTVTFNATMTATTVTVNGTPVTVVTLQLGTLPGGGSALRTVSISSAMVWSPAAAVTDLFDSACSPTPVIETGTADPEF